MEETKAIPAKLPSHIRTIPAYLDYIGCTEDFWTAYMSSGKDLQAAKDYLLSIPNIPDRFKPKNDAIFLRSLRHMEDTRFKNEIKAAGASSDNTAESNEATELLEGLDSILKLDAGAPGAVQQNLIKICLTEYTKLKNDMKADPSKNNHTSMIKYIEQIRFLTEGIQKSAQSQTEIIASVRKYSETESAKVLEAVRSVVFELFPGKADEFAEALKRKLGSNHDTNNP